jgi:hypothetical protein
MSNKRYRARRVVGKTQRRMRRISIGAAAVVGLLAVVVVVLQMGGGSTPQSADHSLKSADQSPPTWTAEPYQGGARLAVDQSVIDEGPVPYGHPVQATFHLKNVGDQPINLGEPEVQILEGC